MESTTFEICIGDMHIVAYKNIRGDQLKPDDLYVAKRNTGWDIGICHKVYLDSGFVESDPPGKIYSYDCHECHKVKDISYTR